ARPSLQLATITFDTSVEFELTSLKPLAAWFEQDSTKSLKDAPNWLGAPVAWTVKVHAPAPTCDSITEFCPEPRMSTYWAKPVSVSPPVFVTVSGLVTTYRPGGKQTSPFELRAALNAFWIAVVSSVVPDRKSTRLNS